MSQSPEATRPSGSAHRTQDSVRALRWRSGFATGACRTERSAKNTTRKNTRRAYERLYDSDCATGRISGFPSDSHFMKRSRRGAAPLAPRRVVDVGCGTGHLLRVARRPDALVPGADRWHRSLKRWNSSCAFRSSRQRAGSSRDLYRLSPRGGSVRSRPLHGSPRARARANARRRSLARTLRARRVPWRSRCPTVRRIPGKGHVNFWTEDELHGFLSPHGLVGIDRIQDGGVLLAWLAPDHPHVMASSDVRGR